MRKLLPEPRMNMHTKVIKYLCARRLVTWNWPASVWPNECINGCNSWHRCNNRCLELQRLRHPLGTTDAGILRPSWRRPLRQQDDFSWQLFLCRMEIYYTSYTLPVISQHIFACISRRTAFVSNPKSCDYSCHATAIRPPRDFRAARCERATSMRRIMEIAWKSRGRRVSRVAVVSQL